MDVRTFSGASEGVPYGACGLLTAAGKFHLSSVLKAASCLQYRGRAGAGITIKGVYPYDADNVFYFHIMYRKKEFVEELERELSSAGLLLEDRSRLINKKWYNQYDMPIMYRYHVTTPPAEDMLYTEQISCPREFIRKKVTEFNILHIDNARIYSSSQDSGTFLTAFTLDDTIKIFNIEQYEDRKLSVVQTHMRWPTSLGRGLWWGPQPIAFGEVSGTHNGHLSSDRSNAIALEQLNIPLTVSTDSEALFRELYYLVSKGYTLKEIEWIVSGKFPQEVELLDEAEQKKYKELTSDPILCRFNISGPSTAIVLIGDIIIALTDRDHMRAFTIGQNENIILLGSEERAVVAAAFALGEDVDIYNPDAGKLVAFKINNGVTKKLDYEWKQTA